MTNILNINPTVPEVPERDPSSKPKELPSVVAGNVDQFGRRVLKLAGPQMNQVPSLPQSVAELHQSLPSPQHPPVSPDRNEESSAVLQEAEETLRDIEDAAEELVQKNIEHRLPDIRDYIPIWANVRSHKMATREGIVIDRLKADVARLSFLVNTHNLPLDLTELFRWADKLRVPGGLGKALATVFLTRAFHRGLSTPRKEKLEQAASDLRKQVRDMAHGVRRNAA